VWERVQCIAVDSHRSLHPGIYSNNLHQAQYVSKLEGVVRFLLHEKRLSLDDLGAMWAAQVDKFDTIVSNIHDLLAKLAWHFDREQLEHLFLCFKKSWGGSSRNMQKLLEFICKV
jgi:ubiquitin carboxyl-terminal hydrolase 9/24